MKILIAPDSFKHCLPADKVAAAIARGVRAALPRAQIITVPLSDGGEGLLQCYAQNLRGGKKFTAPSCDALKRPRRAAYAIFGQQAIVETAAANGIELLAPSELAPLRATSFGAGMILEAIRKRGGVKEIVVGIGGSATIDGGAGMLQALGAEFFDRAGKRLPDGLGGVLIKIARVNASKIKMNWRGVKITIAADVTNPLTGERGAAKIFGPQKGASPAQVKILDAGLRHFAEICGDRGEHRGDGAAGGLGFALRKFLGAKMVSGAEQLFRDFDFAKKLRGADLVITGEGQSDAQTAGGKLAVKVAQAARKEKVPALLLSGALAPDAEILEPFFAAGIFAIATQPQTLTAALAAAEKNLERAARNLLKAIFARS